MLRHFLLSQHFRVAVTVAVRRFDSSNRVASERGFGYKMRDIPVLTGNPRPVAHEEDWHCRYKLSDRMEDVLRDVLTKAGWSAVEIEREYNEMFERKRSGATAVSNTWSTVEEFQRTPWYRRYRPTEDNTLKFISYETIKLLEEALIPPSLRSDPYAHLRKRHMEDNWFHERFSEDRAKYVTRDKLAMHTKGMPQYGSVTRKKFLEFEKSFRKMHGGFIQRDEVYSAWLQANGNEK